MEIILWYIFTVDTAGQMCLFMLPLMSLMFGTHSVLTGHLPPSLLSLVLLCSSHLRPQTAELIRALQELENAASGDSVLRQRISSLPAEVQDTSLLHRITGGRQDTGHDCVLIQYSWAWSRLKTLAQASVACVASHLCRFDCCIFLLPFSHVSKTSYWIQIWWLVSSLCDMMAWCWELSSLENRAFCHSSLIEHQSLLNQ